MNITTTRSVLGHTLCALALASAALLTLASAEAAARVSLPSANVAWQAAASDADIERAFAQARKDKKPVLLYWGATWCPPCNQLKATLFNRQDFAVLSRNWVAVHVDGDRPGAQKLGQRFKVSGYPTVVLFSADGGEITRLPGEVDAPQALAVLQQGLAGGRAIKAVLADALAAKPLSPGDWQMLSFYSWETSEQQLLPKAEVASTLARLAALSSSVSADSDTSTRLWLKTLASADKDFKADAALRARVLAVLENPATARTHMDVLVNSADDIVRVLEATSGTAINQGRAALVARWDAALKRLQSDTSLSRSDRFQALASRVELARLDEPKDSVTPKLDAALQDELRTQTKRLDSEITDGYERQAVITAAAYTLTRAGLWTDSDALLKANLTKSHSPYYLMSQLGSNARKQGQEAEALSWYAQAFDKSQGPATRLQWGASYLQVLVDLTPQDSARIERTAAQLLNEAAKDGAAFEARSARSLQRVGSKLVGWSTAGQHAATMKRLQAQLRNICPKVQAQQRAACEGLFKPAAPAKPAA